jgi:hypothetical protein
MNERGAVTLGLPKGIAMLEVGTTKESVTVDEGIFTTMPGASVALPLSSIDASSSPYK